MSAFETTYNIIGISAHGPSVEDVEGGADPLVLVRVTPGLMLPIPNPRNPTQPLIIPIGDVQYRLDRTAAIEFGHNLVEEGERLPLPKPKIDVATSLAGVDAVADRLADLKAA